MIVKLPTLGERTWNTVEADLRAGYLRIGCQLEFVNALLAEVKARLQAQGLFDAQDIEIIEAKSPEDLAMQLFGELQRKILGKYFNALVLAVQDLELVRRGGEPIADADTLADPADSIRLVYDADRDGGESPPRT